MKKGKRKTKQNGEPSKKEIPGRAGIIGSTGETLF